LQLTIVVDEEAVVSEIVEVAVPASAAHPSPPS
jgi:hypothetical protein